MRAGARASCSRAPASPPSPGFRTSGRREESGSGTTRPRSRTSTHFAATRRACGSSTRCGSLRSARAEPNDGHRALAELEERGWIGTIVTQNVDGLHQRAGSREVVEVHGSLREAECVHCRSARPAGGRRGDAAAAAVPRVRGGPQARRRDVRRAAAGGGDPARAGSSRPRPISCSSSARRSRCIRSPSCPARRSGRAACSRSSTAAPHIGTRAPRSCSTPVRARRYARWRVGSISSTPTDRGGADG